MCDTLLQRLEDQLWFAKNSDREPKEPQLVEWFEPFTGAPLQPTTYLKVEVPAQRHGVLLSRPVWMWGAEMGLNDQGVVIGNEAVYTRLIDHKGQSLLGMDLIRLALEQAENADQALQVITHYLALHGQAGPAGFHDKKFRYDNSFLIADANGGWQLETAGQFWVAKKVGTAVGETAAISNALTIGSDFDCCSEDLQGQARQQGYWNGKGDFHFKNTFATTFIPWAAKSDYRRSSNLQGLSTPNSELPVAAQLAHLLRRHRGHKPSSNADVCMHSAGIHRPSETTQSMIVGLSSAEPQVWMTGGSLPCLSSYKVVVPGRDYWLADQVDFWKQWREVLAATKRKQNLQKSLRTLNLQFETKIWARPDDHIKLTAHWWRQVQQLIR